MSWLWGGGLACLAAARLLAIWLCLGHRYPAWRRRLAEGRVSGPLAFWMLHANPLFDGQGFLDWHHPGNRRERPRSAAVGAVFLALALPAFGGLAAAIGRM